MKRTIIISFFLGLWAGPVFSQLAWIEPSGADFRPTAEATLYIDVSQSECDRLVGTTEDVYMWTWMPSDPQGFLEVDGQDVAVGGNGQWTASNPLLKMTHRPEIGPDVYSFTMIPTKFYGVTEADVYTNGFALLAKLEDGSGGGGGGCDEDKTDDAFVTVEAPGLPKVFSIPRGEGSFSDTVALPLTANDLFTVRYDKTTEEKASLIDGDEFYVYLRGVGDDGQQYRVAPNLGSVDETEELKMTRQSDRVFTFSFIPNEIFPDKPDGVDIIYFRFQIVVKGFSTTDDIVAVGPNNEFRYEFLCD